MAASQVGRAKAGREPRFSEDGSGVGGLLIGLAFAALVLAANDSDEVFSETTQRLAIAGLACLPGTLCMMARWSRPSLYLAGGIVGMSVPMLFGSILGIGFWVPAVLAFVAYGRRSSTARGRLSHAVVVLTCFALALGAFAAMFVHEDPACSNTANSSYCTSDYVTTAEGLISFGIAFITPIIAWFLSRPRNDA